jgi:S-adenosylmethionine-dependent methyltransferase
MQTTVMRDDAWAPFAERFVDGHYGSLRGRVRTHVLHEHLRWHLPPPPVEIVDVGGGAGHDAVPLARAGYHVTIVDPSESMLDRASTLVATEAPDVRTRIDLVHARGEDAPATLGRRYGAVFCHGVLMYLDDPRELEHAIADLVDDEGIISVVAKNARTLAVRPALTGQWQEALTAFDARRQVNGLNVDTRADTIEELTLRLSERNVELLAWYGVRLFTDGWSPDRPATDIDADVFAVELEASRRDPYRQMSRLFHYVGRRQAADGCS